MRPRTFWFLPSSSPLYEHVEFGGRCETFTADATDLVDTFIGDDTISSIRVGGGCDGAAQGSDTDPDQEAEETLVLGWRTGTDDSWSSLLAGLALLLALGRRLLASPLL